jgi:SET domain-containing protein
MMLVKTYIKESTIPEAGLGCFAAEFIPKDTLIWIFNPSLDRDLSEHQLGGFSSLEKDFIKTYAYKHNGYYYLCIDNGRFINHADNPNTYESKQMQATYALKDIAEGEEILSNYAEFGITQDDLRYNTL